MKYSRWETPVSDARSLAMVSLVDRDGLRVTVQDLRDPARRRFEFTFRGVAAYRNILEEYRINEEIEPNTAAKPEPGRASWTAIALESTWLAELRAKEPLLDVHSPGCRHFVIQTEDDVLDIITPDEPEIRELAPAGPNDPTPGKSQILYHPDNREEIDRVFDGLRGKDPPPRSPGSG